MNNMSASLTVFIVDDDVAILTALTRLLKSEGIATQTFHCAEEFLRLHDSTMPGCIVLDLFMPDLSGLHVQQRLTESGSDHPIVFITGGGDVPTSVEAMKAGAVDFLGKPFQDEDFLAAVRQACERDRIARLRRAECQCVQLRLATLTPREREVLWHVVNGRLNKQIAAELGTVEKTIKVHRARVMEKMGASSLAELVRMVLQSDAREAALVVGDSGHPPHAISSSFKGTSGLTGMGFS